MLLAIDAGNTETVVGLFSLGPGDDPPPQSRPAPPVPPEPAGLSHHWRLSTVDDRTPDEHALLLSQLLDLDQMDVDEVVSGLAVTSSVPRVTTSLRQMAQRWFDVPCVVLEPGVRSGMPILYDNPKEVGSDRIMNALAAVHLYGGPAIVVDFGTATNFDAVSEKGEFVGGAFAPGIEISVDALSRRAAQLLKVELARPNRVIGKNTVESLQSGIIFGFAGQIEGIARRMAEELAPDDPDSVTIIATGGLAPLVIDEVGVIDVYDPWLTLTGLRLVYERNTSGG